ncbi:metallohydrolase [uncultured Roseobacter sp.]|uniref:metallohydrolase n=1 Tax=uncultured Roseobacter sp. TaxID=114847 RepID=UPI0026068A6E|nr:metallohydrolase [uncultured Roseobacter sp.]
MTVETYHFKVANGDMSLMKTNSGRFILIDINIGTSADDENEDAPNVGAQLRDALDRDSDGRLFVDAFMLTHPDMDHCSGLENHFHLGKIEDWSAEDDKIVIREMWSSPIVFKRASSANKLCADAKAWATEARRRVEMFRQDEVIGDGSRILILSEDANGKTDDLADILIKTGETISVICGETDDSFEAILLAPLPITDDEDEEELLSKNNSSVITQFTLAIDGTENAAQYLFGGDAEVAIWEKIWAEYSETPKVLAYDVLIAPHHCSWRSLSHDSWSKKGKGAVVSDDARSALSQANVGAIILASSKSVVDDDNDPPCIRAKDEYEDILSAADINGEFRCLQDENGDKPVQMEITKDGPKVVALKVAAVISSSSALGVEAHAHGSRSDEA